MVDLQKRFNNWLDEPMVCGLGKNRREWAEVMQIKVVDLEWAYMAGWLQCEYYANKKEIQ